MHTGILSDRERAVLRQYLQKREKGEGFRVLKMRLKRNYSRIEEDFQLIKLVKEKLQSLSLDELGQK